MRVAIATALFVPVLLGSASDKINQRFHETVDSAKSEIKRMHKSHNTTDIFNKTLDTIDDKFKALANYINETMSSMYVSLDLKHVPTKQPEQVNSWNPGGQGEGFGEPQRSETGGYFRYMAGRGKDDSHDWQSGQGKGQGGPSQGGQSQGQGADFDWKQYAGGYGATGGSQTAPQDKRERGSTEQALLFNVTVTGRDIEVTSSFGLGGGRGDGQSAATGPEAGTGAGAGSGSGSGGGGGGQHTIRLRRGSVTLSGGFDGETVARNVIVA